MTGGSTGCTCWPRAKAVRRKRPPSVDALNNTTHYTYDVMNRLTKITAPDGSTTQFAYDYRGRRIAVTDPNGKTTAYQYDDADRLVAVTDPARAERL